MPRPILATVHTDALRHNLERVRRNALDSRVWAVVKANAYGHGIERVYEGLRGADGFALLDLAEAQRVRALGWRGPVLLLEGVFEARDLELRRRLLAHLVALSRELRVDARELLFGGQLLVLRRRLLEELFHGGAEVRHLSLSLL